jgi:integrase/recombinase XerC
LDIAELLAGVRAEERMLLLWDWDRSLRAGNQPETTRYNYVLAACQLAAYLYDQTLQSAGAGDPALVERRQVVAFQAWMIETRSASTGLNKHKALQQFFRWLAEENEIERSPMHDLPQPRAAQKLVDLMLLLGWTSEEMPRRYGASAAAQRAQHVHARLGIGERV